jgi:hypothetical protein
MLTKKPRPKALTKNMISILMECHERELMNQEPCDFNNAPQAQRLITRGLLEVRNFSRRGREIKAFYITTLGKKLLSSL